MPAAALRKRLIDKLQLHHRLVRPSEQVRGRFLCLLWLCQEGSHQLVQARSCPLTRPLDLAAGPGATPPLNVWLMHCRCLPVCLREMWRWFARARSSPLSYRASGDTAATSQAGGGKGSAKGGAGSGLQALEMSDVLRISVQIVVVALSQPVQNCQRAAVLPALLAAAVSHVESFVLLSSCTLNHRFPFHLLHLPWCSREPRGELCTVPR